jgi:hypothetical protein
MGDLQRVKDRSLLQAAQTNDTAAVLQLLQSGARPTERVLAKRTALHFACLNGNVSAQDALLSAGADVEAREENGLSPLFCVLAGGSPWLAETFSCLLRRGANWRVASFNGESLWSAVKAADKPRVLPFLAHGLTNKELLTVLRPLCPAEEVKLCFETADLVQLWVRAAAKQDLRLRLLAAVDTLDGPWSSPAHARSAVQYAFTGAGQVQAQLTEQLTQAVFSGAEADVDSLLAALKQHAPQFDVNARVEVVINGKPGLSTLIQIAAERSNVRILRRLLDCPGAQLGCAEGSSCTAPPRTGGLQTWRSCCAAARRSAHSAAPAAASRRCTRLRRRQSSTPDWWSCLCAAART